MGETFFYVEHQADLMGSYDRFFLCFLTRIPYLSTDTDCSTSFWWNQHASQGSSKVRIELHITVLGLMS